MFFFSFKQKESKILLVYCEIKAITTADDAKVSEVQPVDLLLAGAVSHEHAIMPL